MLQLSKNVWHFSVSLADQKLMAFLYFQNPQNWVGELLVECT